MHIIKQVLADNASITIQRPTDTFKITDVGTLIAGVVKFALIIAAILVFVYLIWGGIQWILSGGDKSKTQEARDRITAALVGLAIVASAWAIMYLIQHFFGINVLDNSVTPPTAY